MLDFDAILHLKNNILKEVSPKTTKHVWAKELASTICEQFSTFFVQHIHPHRCFVKGCTPTKKLKLETRKLHCEALIKKVAVRNRNKQQENMKSCSALQASLIKEAAQPQN